MGAGYRNGRLGVGDDLQIGRRIGLIGGLLVLAFLVFLVRLFQLQILEGADFRTRSLENSVRSERLEAPRGEILDREGRVLASSRPAFRVQVIPNEVINPDFIYRALGQILGRDHRELLGLVGRPRGRERFQPIVLDGDMTPEEHARVETHRYALPGVVTASLPRRHYVEVRLAAHLLGTIGQIEASQLDQPRFEGYRAGEIIGQAGLESRLEGHLRGRVGGRNLVVDVAGREIEVIAEVDPTPGGRVVLTLDLDLQREAEAAFGVKEPGESDMMGALVALDPRNGDVLAMLSKPSYDPNAFAGGIDAATWQELNRDPWKPLNNRAISGLYPPGSTYKAFVAAAALAEGEIDPEEKIFCPGYFRLGRRVYRCWKRAGHGALDLHEALTQSCDVYFYNIGSQLGIERLAHYARGFGFGRRTQVDLPSERSGLVPTPEWKERARKEVWLKGETVSASIGQGFNLVTPIQLAVAFAAIGNGGTLYKPRLVLRVETWQGELLEERPVVELGTVPVSATHLERVRVALTSVVQGPKGTGRRARVRGVNVAGKTGTTQVVGLQLTEGLEDAEIPLEHRDHAWFAAFAPAEAPEIVVVALVEHGGSGGSVAAPIVQRVLARYFEKQRGAVESQLALRSRPAAPERPLAVLGGLARAAD